MPTGRGELYRALLGETMFFLEAFEKLEEHGIVINDILATGGAAPTSGSKLGRMLGRPVRRASENRGRQAAIAPAQSGSETIWQGVGPLKGLKDFVQQCTCRTL